MTGLRSTQIAGVRWQLARGYARVGSRKRFVRHLATVPVFASAGRRTLARVARWGDVIEVRPGDVLAREGRSNRWFFVILSGSVKVTHNRHHVATLHRGGHFGEVAVVGFRPQNATVTAVESTVLFVLGRRHLVSVAAMDEGVQRALFPEIDVRDYTAFVRRLHEDGRREWERLGPHPVDAAAVKAAPQRPPGRRLSITEAAAVLTHADADGPVASGVMPAIDRSRERRLVMIASAVLLASLLASAFLYHPPVAVVSPARAIDVTSDITITGAPVGRPTGRYVLTAANVDRPNLASAALAWIARRRVVGIRPREPSQLRDEQRAVHAAFLESQRQAVSVAKRSLGSRARNIAIVIRDRGIGGPSAGLIYALAIIDMVDGSDLAEGRVIAATGELDRSGRVRDVGYVEMKAEAARRAGADVFLVPASQVELASGGAARIVGVRDLAGAVAALRRPG